MLQAVGCTGHACRGRGGGGASWLPLLSVLQVAVVAWLKVGAVGCCCVAGWCFLQAVAACCFAVCGFLLLQYVALLLVACCCLSFVSCCCILLCCRWRLRSFAVFSMFLVICFKNLLKTLKKL